jgi:hypothetical protein
LPLKDNISNIVIFNDLDTNDVWGEFVYLNNVYKNLPFQIEPYINNFVINDRDKRRMDKIGFNNDKINLFFTENQDDRVWYYFIDTGKGIIYFDNSRSRLTPSNTR